MKFITTKHAIVNRNIDGEPEILAARNEVLIVRSEEDQFGVIAVATEEESNNLFLVHISEVNDVMDTDRADDSFPTAEEIAAWRRNNEPSVETSHWGWGERNNYNPPGIDEVGTISLSAFENKDITGVTSNAHHVYHHYDNDGARVTTKIEKNTKGYNWEVSVSGAAEVDEAVAKLADAETLLKGMYGEKVAEKKKAA